MKTIDSVVDQQIWLPDNDATREKGLQNRLVHVQRKAGPDTVVVVLGGTHEYTLRVRDLFGNQDRQAA